MTESRPSDLARQIAVLLMAIAQIAASYSIGREVGGVAQEYRTFVFPTTWAFSIWGIIFLLCLIYGIYQALPAQRESPIFRAVGWWSAAAFLCNSLWNQVFISRQFALAQIVIFAGFVCAGMAYWRFVQTAGGRRLPQVMHWVVGPVFGLLFGWITAANVVGLASTLVANGVSATGEGAEPGAAALLIFGSAIAFFVIVLSRSGPASAWIAYAAAVIWALVAVFIEQQAASPLASGAAVAGILLILLALIGPWNRRGAPALPASA
ncbi:MAG: hypothetical protein QM692_19950 [Thermomicrobiales bacterium]